MKEREGQKRGSRERFDWLSFLDKNKKRIKIFILVLIIFFLARSFYRSNLSFQKTDYAVTSPDIPNSFNGFTICQISDLHGHLFGGQGEALLEAVEERKPDIIVLTGDVISISVNEPAKEEKERLGHFLKALSNIAQTFFIPGNHELGMEEVFSPFFLSDLLKEAGITDLSNRTLPLLRGGKKIYISGLKEGRYFYSNSAVQTLPVHEFLERGRDEDFHILLAHNPFYWTEYKTWGADLTLSGHVHGGGIRLPLIGGVFSPEVAFFPKYDLGLYEDSPYTMVVSAGLGNSGLPFRLFNPEELVFVHLESKSIK